MNMKSIIFLVITTFSTTLFAQLKVAIKEETKAMSKGNFNALVAVLPGTSVKDVERFWKQHLKKFKGKLRYERKVNEHIVDDATIKDMSDNTVDIFSKVEESGAEGVSLSVWFNLGASFLSSKDYSDRYPAGEKILLDFVDQVSVDLILDELKLQEKILKERENELKKLEKEKADHEKDIDNAKKTIKKMEENIEKAEGDIEKNIEAQKDKTGEIEAQKKVVEEVNQRLQSVKKGKR